MKTIRNENLQPKKAVAGTFPTFQRLYQKPKKTKTQVNYVQYVPLNLSLLNRANGENHKGCQKEFPHTQLTSRPLGRGVFFVRGAVGIIHSGCKYLSPKRTAQDELISTILLTG